ncbi:hypothetical protein BH23ACT9_BH23ACT9_23800 [soil metagenome]
MSASPPWVPAVTADPAVKRLRDDVCRILALGGVLTTASLGDRLLGLWGREAPPPEWLAAALMGDGRLWRLPDGRWLHLGTAVHARHFTTRRSASLRHTGVLPVGDDLAVPLLPFSGWDRIPVQTDRGRGLIERAVGGTGTEVLVCPVDLVPDVGGPFVALIPGPEGLHLRDADLDEVADARYRRSLQHRVHVHGPLAPACDPTGAVPRRWSAVDIELLLLTADPGVRCSPTTPSGEVLAAVAADRSASL